MAKKSRASRNRPVPLLETAQLPSSRSVPNNAASGHKVWSNSSASLARIAGKAKVAPPKPLEKKLGQDAEVWPSLPSSVVAVEAPQPRREPEITHPTQLTRPTQPMRPQQTPQVQRTEQPPGCRRVDGVMVSPEPVESPRRVLQRWLDAGKPAVAVYALSVNDAEFRAFKRAVRVVAKQNSSESWSPDSSPGNSRPGSPGSSPSLPPQSKRMRGEDPPIDYETALRLMADLAHVNVGTSRKLGLSTTTHSRPNNAVRCFEFGQVCAPLPMILQHVC